MEKGVCRVVRLILDLRGIIILEVCGFCPTGRGCSLQTTSPSRPPQVCSPGTIPSLLAPERDSLLGRRQISGSRHGWRRETG